MCLKDLTKVPLGPFTVMVLDLTWTWTIYFKEKVNWLVIFITVAWDINSICFDNVFHFLK